MNFLTPKNRIMNVKGNDELKSFTPRFFFDDDFDNFFFSTPKRNDMKCDIYEQDNKYHIEMDIPGFSKDDIEIEVDNGYLTVKASKSAETNEDDKNYIRRERSYGEYQRSFALNDADEENIDAKFEQGMLKIVIPQKAAIETKKLIEIK